MPPNPIGELLSKVLSDKFWKDPTRPTQNYFLEELAKLINQPEQRQELAKQLEVMHSRAQTPEAHSGEAIALFHRFGLLQNTVEREHLTRDWFQGWFPSQPVAELFTRAIALAIQQASDPQRHIEFYWIGSADRHVRISVASSPVQINVFIQTPPPAYERLAKQDDAIDPIVTFGAGPDGIEVVPLKRQSLIGNDQNLRSGIGLWTTRAQRFLRTLT